jgi:hypothetical protein
MERAAPLTDRRGRSGSRRSVRSTQAEEWTGHAEIGRDDHAVGTKQLRVVGSTQHRQFVCNLLITKGVFISVARREKRIRLDGQCIISLKACI